MIIFLYSIKRFAVKISIVFMGCIAITIIRSECLEEIRRPISTIKFMYQTILKQKYQIRRRHYIRETPRFANIACHSMKNLVYLCIRSVKILE